MTLIVLSILSGGYLFVICYSICDCIRKNDWLARKIFFSMFDCNRQLKNKEAGVTQIRFIGKA